MEEKTGQGPAASDRGEAKQTGIKVGLLPFEGLVNRLSSTLRRITRKLNGHFTFMDDQDLFQEALIHLWSHFQSGDLSDKTESYVLQGCYFHLKNYIRKTQDSATIVSLSSIMEEDGPHLEEILVADDLMSYEEVDAGLQIEAIAGSGASKRERDVLFFCLEGMTMREIGKKLGISHVSVLKIRNKIRERYEKLNGIVPGVEKSEKTIAKRYQKRRPPTCTISDTVMCRETTAF
ncbi:MAG: sigma-70 family RNA polymerase sigma factor [Syntrophorhabdales bacterium]